MLHKQSTTDPYPGFPRIEERLSENPARWLDGCENGLTPTARALLRGVDSLERAQNWLYVAERIGCPDSVCDSVEQRVQSLRDAGSVSDRLLAHDAQARLREAYHASSDRRQEILEREASSDRDSKTVVVALINQLKQQTTSSETDNAADAAANSPAPTTDDSDGQMSVEEAREIVADLDRSRAVELLYMERKKDEPREALVDAFQQKVDGNFASDTDTSEVAAHV